MKTELQLHLQQDLKRFGLNPKEWSFSKTKHQSFQIRHKSDPGFQLHGKAAVKSKTAFWREIELHSL